MTILFFKLFLEVSEASIIDVVDLNCERLNYFLHNASNLNYLYLSDIILIEMYKKITP